MTGVSFVAAEILTVVKASLSPMGQVRLSRRRSPDG
jgi:hypothetical protein